MPRSIDVLLIGAIKTDSDYIHQILQRCVRSTIRLISEQNVSLAQERLKNQHYDVALIAGTDNFKTQLEQIRWIRGDSNKNQIAIIVLTEQDNPTIYQQAERAGASDCLAIDQLTTPLLEHSILHSIQSQRDENKILQLANFDLLTGLANRRHFKLWLDELLNQNRRSEKLVALMFINLDNFQHINSTLGQGAGDEVLTQVADRLHNSIRESDFIARLGGDEFAIIASQLNQPEDASIMAEGLLRACHFSLESELEDLTVTCSIGISLFPQDTQDAKQLLNKADKALKNAKASGGGCYYFSEHRLNQQNWQHHRLSADMGHAILRNQLCLYFQPIISLQDTTVTGVEALLRWEHPVKGLLEPDEFLSVAEDSGMIHAIGSWVLHNACDQHRQWRSQGLPPIPISVNLSPMQLEQHTLTKTINDITQQDGFDVNYLTVELSEEAIYNCNSVASETLVELNDMGIQITVDDFGKDFCSLKHLSRFPVSSVKIDRSLISNLEENSENAQVSSAIIQLCQALGIDVVAKGVEDHSAISFLNSKQCSQFQGFGISKPLPAEDFPHWFDLFSKGRAQFALH